MVLGWKSYYYLLENESTQDLIKMEISSNGSVNGLQVIQAGLQARGFSITSDSRKLCYTKNINFSNLWSFTYNERKNLFESKKLTEGTSLFANPEISPDGNEIVFSHNENIFKMTSNGDSIKQLTFLKLLVEVQVGILMVRKLLLLVD